MPSSIRKLVAVAVWGGGGVFMALATIGSKYCCDPIIQSGPKFLFRPLKNEFFFFKSCSATSQFNQVYSTVYPRGVGEERADLYLINNVIPSRHKLSLWHSHLLFPFFFP